MNVNNSFDISGNGNSVSFHQENIVGIGIKILGLIFNFVLALIALLLSPILIPLFFLIQGANGGGSDNG